MPAISDFDNKAAWTIAALDLAITPQELQPVGPLDGLDLAGKPGDRDEIDPDRGRGVLAALDALADPANAREDELKGVRSARETVKATLTQLPTLTSAAAARDQLAAVQDEIDAATKAVAARFEAERQRRESALKQAVTSADNARNAARDQLTESFDYVTAVIGKALQGEFDELEKSSQQTRADAQKTTDPRSAVEDFDRVLAAIGGEAAATESFVNKVKTARTEAVAARGKLKKEWDDKIVSACQRGIEAARYNLDISSPSKELVDDENSIAKQRFALEALQKDAAWDAQGKQAEFDAVVGRIDAPFTELEKLLKAMNVKTAAKEIAGISAKGFSLDTYDQVSASLSAMPARRQHFDGLAAQAKEAKGAGDPLGEAKAVRTLATELPPVKEFAEGFNKLVNGEVARVQKESAPGQSKVLADLVTAISTVAENDLEAAKARLLDLEKLAKTVDAFNQKLAKLKNGDYKMAVAGGSLDQQKTLTEALDAVEKIPSDDVALSGAESGLTTLMTAVSDVKAVITAFTRLFDSAQGPIDKASETRRMSKKALLEERDRIRGLRTKGYDEATTALNTFVTKLKEVPALLKRYDGYSTTVMNISGTTDKTLKKQADTALSAATECFTNLRFEKIDEALNAVEKVLKLVDQKRKNLSNAKGVSKNTSGELQGAIAKACDALEQDPTQEKADELEKLLADVETVTPLIKRAEKMHQEALTQVQDPAEQQRLTGHLAAGVKAANAQDFGLAKSELALAVPDSLLETRYKNALQASEATHNTRATEAKTYKLKEGSKLTALMKKAVTAAGTGNYEEAFDALQELQSLYPQIERLAEESQYEAEEKTFNAVYSPAWTAAHSTFKSEMSTWRGQATSLVGGRSVANYRAARAKLAEITVDLPTIADYAKLTKTVYVSYETRLTKSVPADITRIKKLYDDASQNAISAPATGLTHLKALETLLKEAATTYTNFTRSIGTATSGIHAARATDDGTIKAGTSPGTKLQEGKLSLADVGAMIPNTVANTFTDSDALKGGFKYIFSSGGNTYRIHGHGPDTKAPAGSNSNSGGNVVRVRRRAADGTEAFLSSDGTWDSSAGANHSDSTHIPLV